VSFASPGLFGPGLQLLPCANIAIHLPQIDIVTKHVAAWLLEAQQLEDIATYQIRGHQGIAAMAGSPAPRIALMRDLRSSSGIKPVFDKTSRDCDPVHASSRHQP